FFQAEDGIRDGHVTGVQTCALPISPELEPVVGDIAAIMGLEVCYRDGNVAKYGLENALLPVDSILLEVVAPFQPGTAAGRFIDKIGRASCRERVWMHGGDGRMRRST